MSDVSDRNINVSFVTSKADAQREKVRKNNFSPEYKMRDFSL